MIEMSEAQWQQRILDFCDYKKVSYFHSHDSRRDDTSKNGFPDLVLVGFNGIVFAELKKQNGRVSKLQAEWHNRLQMAGAKVYVWRPEDWDEVQHVIGKLA